MDKDESTEVRPEAQKLQTMLIDVARKSGCTPEEVLLAACALAGNAIAWGHVDHDQTRASVQKAAKAIEIVVKWLLPRASTDNPN